MLDVAPSTTPPTTTGGPDHAAGPLDWTAAGLLLAGAVLGVVSLFPAYYSGQGALDTRADEIVPVAVVVAGWLVCGALVASRRAALVAAGAWSAVGIAVAELGLRVADVGQLTSGISGGEGLWLLSLAWAVAAVGAAVAVASCRRTGLGGLPARPGPAGGWDRTVGVVTVAAGILAAIAFVPSWDRYLATSAVDPGFFADVTLGNALHNPGVVIGGNIAAAAAFGLLPILAVLWRPMRTGGALLAGVVVVLTAQVLSAAAQVLETPDLLQLFTPAQAQAVQPTVTLHLTGWFDAELGALLLLLLVATSRLHHPYEPASAQPPPSDLDSWEQLGHPGDPAGAPLPPAAYPGPVTPPTLPPPPFAVAPAPASAPAAPADHGPVTVLGDGPPDPGPDAAAPSEPQGTRPDAAPASRASWGDIPAPSWEPDDDHGSEARP